MPRAAPFVLQRWDLETGERMIVPVVDEDGNAIELDRDHGMHASQGLPGEQDRRFLGDDGRVWSVDLSVAGPSTSFPSRGTRPMAMLQSS